ncbi:molecular chaperone HtpG [Amylibacter sp.]|jgi:molecular chaperone HtpG|nr:molecular chaperone HtpG [Amylibacter sp.]MDB4146396.1 molecular chaperone HtpG [Amylibacter sp.]MDC1445451.1 molecular chaperone HtpG [Amylibacter sp.]MDC1488833.1 molecular chaperone HtpG [Amylibacter sp.]|tara:strand:+ start:170 stop:2014 length:1845 start_codon:yes stop_codon:yes gene_type:complete
MEKFSQAFEADTGKILNIVINSLYSDRDIFLRELLSNASDAIQKRRFLGQTTPEILNLKDDEIEIIVDKKKKTIEIIDTGIGLTQEELVETLGTIAQSGTANFLKENDNENDQKNLEQTLIGQFGVGFYSAFMVSKIVEVTSRKAGTKNSSVWESDGQSGYSITEAENEHPVGTSIKLFLKKDAKNYCESAQIETLIKKYSDHIQVPVKIKETDGESQQVNSATALWTKQSQDISKEEYKDFYNSNFATFDDPFLTLHNKSEGTLEFTNLLFVPTQAPFDLFEPERKTNISLYINRVFITDEIQDVIPTWLRFVKGILDTSSLDLNVSREMVQNSPVLKKISKAITKRVISGLKKKLTKEEEAYDAFWGNFGKVIKEGLYEDFENRNKIAEIIKVYSFKEDKLITLKAYLENFTEGQDQIFYLTADTLSQAQSSPHLEGFKSKGIDVLLMTDPIDAFWISQIQNFQEKPFISISRDKYDISKTGTDSSIPNDTNKENEEIYTKLIKECLGDLIQDVTISSNLVDSPVRLIAGEGGLDFNLERILKAQGQDFEGSKKVIEINTNHELIKKLPSLTEDLQKATCRVIFEQARIQDGEMPTNTRQFSQDLIKLVLEV